MRYLNHRIFFSFLFSVFSLHVNSQKVSSSIRVSAGPVNGVFIERNGKNLVVYGDPKGEIKKSDMVLFTHFRRDVVWAGRSLVQGGALAVVPASQKSYFTKGDSIWSKFATARFHDYSNQTTKIGISPIDVSRFVRGGDVLIWQDIDFKVLNTTGYTRGSVSYIADIDGKRYAFVGDLIYGDGKIYDLYSFQDSLPGVDGYHGYAARLGQLIKSLQLVAGEKPDVLIPSRGPVINDPEAAIQKLIYRIRGLYQNYLSITAQRWNHTDRMITLSNHVLGQPSVVDWMPFSSVIQSNPPSWYQHINNSNLIVSDDGNAFLIDCGTKQAFEELMRLKKSGRLKHLEGLFITHYHDDHTDLVNNIVKEFSCPVYVTKELADILKNPGAYNMPCLTNSAITNLTIMQEGQKMLWRDFTLTFVYFPGQTLYHDGLLVEKKNGESIFFTGDSFTPAGIDDYCFQNRNLLHEGTGYFHCLDVLKKLPSNTLLSNQHIKPLFTFSSEQLDHMKSVLQERNKIIENLVPWDNVNYGTDSQWIRISPYALKTKRGKAMECSVKIFNHSDIAKTFTVEPILPTGFSIKRKLAPLLVGPRTEGEGRFELIVSNRAATGLSLLLLNVKFDHWDLREWTEALVEVE